MRRRWVIPLIVAIVLVGLLLLTALSRRPLQQIIVAPTPTPGGTSPAPTATTTPSPSPRISPATTSTPTPLRQVQINVASPQQNQIVTSPLKVTGQAQGPWFFEATAPIRLVDANGRVLAQGFITAQGDWMTTNFVPFSGELTFSNPQTDTGRLILAKNNPSGLPQNDQEISIPVRFR